MASRNEFSSIKILTLLNGIAPGKFKEAEIVGEMKEEVPNSTSTIMTSTTLPNPKSPLEFEAQTEGRADNMLANMLRREEFDEYLCLHSKANGYQVSYQAVTRGDQDSNMQWLYYPHLKVTDQVTFFKFLIRENEAKGCNKEEVAELKKHLSKGMA